MALNKVRGNMYPWCTHTHTHIGGECPHGCLYCYVQRGAARLSKRYIGDLKLFDKELNVKYGKGRTIFVEHLNDMWAWQVSPEWIDKILNHCNSYPNNTYVFQTKNPARYLGFLDKLPKKTMLGITLETNRNLEYLSKAPSPVLRWADFIDVKKELNRMQKAVTTFVTIEPILKFDLDVFVSMLSSIRPDFINIGADSKGSNLEEPTGDEIISLIENIKAEKISILKKENLERLMG